MRNRGPNRFGAALGALTATLLIVGCHDPSGPLHVASSAPRAIVPRIIITRDTGATFVATVALDVSGTVGKIGSFTGSLRFDATRVVYVGDVAATDGTTRVFNHVTDAIRVAGISTNGVNVAQVAAFRFVARDASALQAMHFDLEEVHELSRASLLSLVRAPNVNRTP
jgi:hypothetical protein